MPFCRLGDRRGDHNLFVRPLWVKDERGVASFTLAMRTEVVDGKRVRRAFICRGAAVSDDEAVWKGEVETDPAPANPKAPAEPTPLRACLVACGLVDDNGAFVGVDESGKLIEGRTPGWVWGN